METRKNYWVDTKEVTVVMAEQSNIKKNIASWSCYWQLFLFCFSFALNGIQALKWAVFLLCLPVYQEFDHLLEEQSPIESYIEWLDSMVDRCVVKVGKE